MKDLVREDPKILAAAERQMQAFARTEEITGGEGRTHSPGSARRLGPYITISREAGAGGGEIAELVGRKLGWDVLDKNLVEQLAERYHLERSRLELVDETKADWAFDILGTLLDPRLISHEKYFVHMTHAVLDAARRGRVVIVGRGASFLLPRARGLAVRIVAGEKYRIARLKERMGCDEPHARRLMVELDTGRRELVRRFFHQDVGDPHLFDLVVAVDRLGPAGAAEVIADAYRRWNPEGAA